MRSKVQGHNSTEYGQEGVRNDALPLNYVLPWWRGCAVDRASDLRFTGSGFESRLGTIT